jgi:hypothetical protein
MAFLSGAAIMILRGCVGYTRGAGATWGVDFAKIHSAGQHWLAGTNPYVDSAIGYAYPPHASSLVALFGLIPFEQARLLNFIVSVCALFGIAAIHLRQASLTMSRESAWPTAVQWTAISYLMVNNATTSSLFFGGIAIPTFFCAAAAWYLVCEKDHPWLGGVFLAFATLKPQLSLFFCLQFLLERRWRTLFAAAGVALVMAAPAMLQLGITGSFSAWFDAMHSYGARAENLVGDGGVMTFDSILISLGFREVSVKWMAFAGFLTAFFCRQNIARTHLLVILPFLSIAFLSSHDGDYVALSFMWLGLFESASLKPMRALVLAAFIALLFVPFGVAQATGSALLLHLRTLTFASAFVAYLLWNVLGAPHRRGTALD